MKKSVLQSFLALAVLTALFSGCAPATASPTITPIPATETPLPTLTPTSIAITVNNRSAIIGRWTETGGGITIEFFEDGTVTSDDDPSVIRGTYKFTDDDTITTQFNDSIIIMDVEISGDTLLLINNGESYHYSRAKAKNDPELVVEGQINEDQLQRLITLEEITSLSVDVGIGNWKLDAEGNTKSRVCRQFLGQSWSANPNYAVNCIMKVATGITLTEAIEWLKNNTQFLPSSPIGLQSAFDYEGDFALYTYLGSNGHSVYAAFLLIDDLLYWSDIDVGTEVGYSPESWFERDGVVIDTYLNNVLMINLTKGK